MIMMMMMIMMIIMMMIICIDRDTVEPGADTFVMLYDLRSLVQ